MRSISAGYKDVTKHNTVHGIINFVLNANELVISIPGKALSEDHYQRERRHNAAPH